ncbi:MAG TPA: nitroreductase family protein [Chthoniobacterales bacterium]
MFLAEFEVLIRQRRATRHFQPVPVERGLLERLLRMAQWAPSGYNLQPTRYIVVEDRALRPALRRACMDQAPVEEAPIVVVFAGDGRAFEDRFDAILAQELREGDMPAAYAERLRRVVPLMCNCGPAGLGWLWKATLLPVVRLFRPLPDVVAVHRRFWTAKQVMLNAMNFILAAEAAGLNTLPMEGFDRNRLRKVLQLPRSMEPVLVVALGYAASSPGRKTRLPLESVVLWR